MSEEKPYYVRPSVTEDLDSLKQELRYLEMQMVRDHADFDKGKLSDAQALAVAAAYATFSYFAKIGDLDYMDQANASVGILSKVVGVDSPFMIISPDEMLNPMHKDLPKSVADWLETDVVTDHLAEAAQKELDDPAGYLTAAQENHLQRLVAKRKKKN